MSSAARSATARPATRRPRASTVAPRRRAALVEVPAPAPSVAGNGVFALVVVGLLVGGMVMLLVLNTTLAQGAFEISSLTSTQNQRAVQEQQLLQQVALEEAPDSLQKRAAALGMVAVTSPVFLRLADGAVLGVPHPATTVPRSLPRRGPPAAGAVTTDAAAADPAPVTDAAAPDGAPQTGAAARGAAKPASGTGR
jgi:hypothetical protein